MANLKITDLPAADPLTGAEVVPIVQAGTTKQTTTQTFNGFALTTQLDLYVNSSTGSDSNDGLTPATPLATIARAYDLVPRTCRAGVGIHLSVGNHTFTQIPRIVTESKSIVWLIGDGAGVVGAQPYNVLASGTVTDAIDSGTELGGRGFISDIDITTYDEFTGKQLHVTGGTQAGAQVGITRCLDASDIIELTHDLNLGVGDTFDIVETAIFLDVAYSATSNSILVEGPGTSEWGFSAPVGGYGFWNVKFRSLRPGSEVHRFTNVQASIYFIATETEGLHWSAISSSFSWMNYALQDYLDLSAPVGSFRPLVGGSLVATYLPPFLHDYSSDQTGSAGNFLIQSSHFPSPCVVAWFQVAGNSTASMNGSRASLVFVSGGGTATMQGTNGGVIDQNSSLPAVWVQPSASFTCRFSYLRLTQRGTGPAIKVEGGEAFIGQFVTNLGLSSVASGVAVEILDGGLVNFLDGTPTLDGGTPGNDVQVDGQAVAANASFTAGNGVSDPLTGARAFQPR